MSDCRYANEEKLLEIEIEPGMKDGQEQKFVAEGIIIFFSLALLIKSY